MPRIQVTTNTETGDSFPVEICCGCAKQYPPNPQTSEDLLIDVAEAVTDIRFASYSDAFCCAKSMVKAMQTTENYPGAVYEDFPDHDYRCVICDEPMSADDYDWPKFK